MTDASESTKRRFRPSTIGGICYLAILAIVVVGVVLAASGSWRTGTRWVAGGLFIFSAVRTVLPQREAGMLEVRNRWIDAGAAAAIGAVLLALATSIPDQPPL